MKQTIKTKFYKTLLSSNTLMMVRTLKFMIICSSLRLVGSCVVSTSIDLDFKELVIGTYKFVVY